MRVSLILSLSFSHIICIEAINSNSSPTVFEKNEENFGENRIVRDSLYSLYTIYFKILLRKLS